jgi:outer membrane beta-barrel protein
MTARAICVTLALAATGARAADDQPPPKPSTTAAPAASTGNASPNASANVQKVALNDLQTIPNDPAVRGAMRGTPASLPPVTAQIFHIGGRIEAQPIIQVSIGDPFYRSILVGLRVERHLDERWSIAGHALGGTSLLSAPVDVCTDASCSGPEADRLRSTPGDVRMMTGVEMGWAPIYGKLSLAGEKTIHFDTYVSLGPEVLLERIAPDAASPVGSRWAFGGRVGIGERVFFSNDFLLRVGANEVLYGARVRGRTELERKLSLEIGVAWMFGGR